jgi:hypothetical protein
MSFHGTCKHSLLHLGSMFEQFLNNLVICRWVGATETTGRYKRSHNYQTHLELAVKYYLGQFRRIRAVSPQWSRSLTFVEWSVSHAGRHWTQRWIQICPVVCQTRWNWMTGVLIYPKLPLACFAVSKFVQDRTTKNDGGLYNTTATGRSNIMRIYVKWTRSIHDTGSHHRKWGAIFQTRGSITLAIRRWRWSHRSIHYILGGNVLLNVVLYKWPSSASNHLIFHQWQTCISRFLSASVAGTCGAVIGECVGGGYMTGWCVG